MSVSRSARLARLTLAASAIVALCGCETGGSGTATATGGPVVVPGPAPTPTPTPVPAPAPAPTPAPTPASTPTNTALSGLVVEGDSISLSWATSYAGIYAQTHPNVVVHDDAVGGSGITALVGRMAAVLAFKPKVITVLIGANDLGGDWNSDEWLAQLWAYIAPLKASGAKVAVGTVLPLNLGDSTPLYIQITSRHNARRVAVNAAIRAAVGSKIDAVLDYAADPEMGIDAAAADKNWFADGVHPTEQGQARMATIYAPVVDRLLAQ